MQIFQERGEPEEVNALRFKWRGKFAAKAGPKLASLGTGYY
jgi:hypothetical protein